MILIRADANEKIGAGHIMRCLSIARAFARQGENVLFVTADHKGDGIIRQAGFRNVCLDTDYSQMDAELSAIKGQILENHPSLLLVDSYYVTERYFNELCEFVHTAYLDDLNKRCWDISCLINYNIFGPVFDYTQYRKKRVRLLLGPAYAPLREEFQGFSPHVIKNTVTDILVSAGGADPEGISEKLMCEVCPSLPEVHFHFIIGALNPRIEKIRQYAAGNISVHVNVQQMSELMKRCDIAISASGSTLYELCATGTPTITYTLADNQIAAAEEFEKQGIMLSAGDCRGQTGFSGIIEGKIRTLMDSVSLRRELSLKMQKLVDGAGAGRIASELLLNTCSEKIPSGWYLERHIDDNTQFQ